MVLVCGSSEEGVGVLLGFLRWGKRIFGDWGIGGIGEGTCESTWRVMSGYFRGLCLET